MTQTVKFTHHPEVLVNYVRIWEMPHPFVVSLGLLPCACGNYSWRHALSLISEGDVDSYISLRAGI